MKLSCGTILITLALLSESYIGSSAVPLSKSDEVDPDLQGLSEILEENSLKAPPGKPRIIVVADSSLLKTLTSLGRGVTHPSLPENILSPERRELGSEASPSVAIIRRDTMRCMVGRVYRPCWEV